MLGLLNLHHLFNELVLLVVDHLRLIQRMLHASQQFLRFVVHLGQR